MNSDQNLDCRGLPEALAVLRIKQALHCTSLDDLKVCVQISEDCCQDAIQSGLQSESACVAVMEVC
ncbi:hypothetical protein KMP13_04090 [Epibacterium ulvae]|uniref:hypothetical protein n=1 Tax=Epibacterium ulvae TaxID=1156985 RepID=UPI001BFC1988|nr:hypothetical protein [Epibacterium ulvae]MBT8153080.1 hypothetical protein [Epibacterium ulvae]